MPRKKTVECTLETIKATGKAVEACIRRNCLSQVSNYKTLCDIFEHCLPDIGLRLRPFLLRASYEFDNRHFDDVLFLASGIELIQISTLIIDDVLDNSQTRNSKPSVYSKWGPSIAVTSGNILSSIGFVFLSEGLNRCQGCKKGEDIFKLFAKTHGDIYIGQFLDLDFEGKPTITEQQYLTMIAKTTGSFIRAPLVAGAMLWDAPRHVISILERAGMDLGVAYQLRDDVIDLLGDPECTGKPKAGDIRECKMRLPMIHALKQGGEESVRVAKILQGKHLLEEFEVEEIAELLNRTNSVDYVVDKTKEFCQRALKSTDNLPTELETLADHLRVVVDLISSFED